jgi:hypothetical protein
LVKENNMEVVIKFSDEDAAEDAKVALDGYKWKAALWELDQHLRSEIKYNEQLSSEVDEAFEKLRGKIREILSENDLQME